MESFHTKYKLSHADVDLSIFCFPFQYLEDLKERGARIIIGEFFERAARVIMCEAYKQGMTQKEGYVWFLPGWYHHDWFDVDAIRENGAKDEFTPNCTTKQMVEVGIHNVIPFVTLYHVAMHAIFNIMQNQVI